MSHEQTFIYRATFTLESDWSTNFSILNKLTPVSYTIQSIVTVSRKTKILQYKRNVRTDTDNMST